MFCSLCVREKREQKTEKFLYIGETCAPFKHRSLAWIQWSIEARQLFEGFDSLELRNEKGLRCEYVIR